MASLKDIRSRMGSVKNTQQITKAMKMVSAVKLRPCSRKYHEYEALRQEFIVYDGQYRCDS